eukprot:4684555-Amphidinium_carterae.1
MQWMHACSARLTPRDSRRRSRSTANIALARMGACHLPKPSTSMIRGLPSVIGNSAMQLLPTLCLVCTSSTREVKTRNGTL